MTSELEYYANKILSPKCVIVPKSPELLEFFEETALKIYENPATNKTNRRYEQVYADTEKMVQEFALEERAGLKRNENKFDYTDRQTYAYDLYDPENDKKFEVKSWAKTYFSFTDYEVKTFRKNLDIVDYLVCAKTVTLEDRYEIYFYMVANAKTFNKYVTKSNYPNGNDYYNHRPAIQEGQAFVQHYAYSV